MILCAVPGIKAPDSSLKLTPTILVMDTSQNGSISAVGVVFVFHTSCHLKALNNKTEQEVSQIKKVTIF